VDAGFDDCDVHHHRRQAEVKGGALIESPIPMPAGLVVKNASKRFLDMERSYALVVEERSMLG